CALLNATLIRPPPPTSCPPSGTSTRTEGRTTCRRLGSRPPLGTSTRTGGRTTRDVRFAPSFAASVPADLDGVPGDRLAGDVRGALRRALRDRRLRLDGVVVLLVLAQAHRVRRCLHAGQ